MNSNKKSSDYERSRSSNILAAVLDYKSNGGTLMSVASRHNVCKSTLHNNLKRYDAGEFIYSEPSKGPGTLLPKELEILLMAEINTSYEIGNGLTKHDIIELAKLFYADYFHESPEHHISNHWYSNFITRAKECFGCEIEERKSDFIDQNILESFHNDYITLVKNINIDINCTEGRKRILNATRVSGAKMPCRNKARAHEDSGIGASQNSSPYREHITVLVGCDASGRRLPTLFIDRRSAKRCNHEETTKDDQQHDDNLDEETHPIPLVNHVKSSSSDENVQLSTSGDGGEDIDNLVTKLDFNTSPELMDAYLTKTTKAHENRVIKQYIELIDINLTKNMIQRPVILIWDACISHVSLANFQFAKSKQINILASPPQISHALQPLEKFCFETLKSTYDKIINNHLFVMRDSMDCIRALSTAIYRGVSGSLIEDGFRACGYYDSTFDPSRFNSYSLTNPQNTKESPDEYLTKLLQGNMDKLEEMVSFEENMQAEQKSKSAKIYKTPVTHVTNVSNAVFLNKMKAKTAELMEAARIREQSRKECQLERENNDLMRKEDDRMQCKTPRTKRSRPVTAVNSDKSAKKSASDYR